MKKFLLALLMAAPALAVAAGNDLFQDQRNPANTATQTRTVTVPNADAIQGYAFTAAVPGNRVPVMFTLGTGLTLTGTVLSATPASVDWPSITNKPAFSTVATTGAYADLIGVPLTFAPSAHAHAAADIASGTLSAARLPALAISQTTGLQAAIDGKMAVPAGSTSQYLRGDGSLAAFPTTFAPSSHQHAAADISSGTLALARLPALPISQTTGLQTAIDAKFNAPNGTALQYVRGDGALATLPVAKRVETYAGTTNASGQITVTYSSAFSTVPVVQPPAPAAANQVWTTVSSTTTGFTLQLNQRNTVTLLSIEVLLGATVPVVGTAATVLVVAQ